MNILNPKEIASELWGAFKTGVVDVADGAWCWVKHAFNLGVESIGKGLCWIHNMVPPWFWTYVPLALIAVGFGLLSLFGEGIWLLIIGGVLFVIEKLYKYVFCDWMSKFSQGDCKDSAPKDTTLDPATQSAVDLGEQIGATTTATDTAKDAAKNAARAARAGTTKTRKTRK